MMRFTGLVLTVLFYTSVAAQENSPYSRYGLGDIAPNHPIVTRGMGGIAAGFSDFQSINFIFFSMQKNYQSTFLSQLCNLSSRNLYAFFRKFLKSSFFL